MSSSASYDVFLSAPMAGLKSAKYPVVRADVMAAVVARALQMNPTDRYLTATAMRADLTARG